MQEIFDTALSVFVLVAGTVIIALFKMYIDKWLGIYEKKVIASVDPEIIKSIEKVAVLGVEAAEQMFGEEIAGEKKFAFVANLISNKFPSADPVLIQAVIESAVLNYNLFKEAVKKENETKNQ